MIEFLLLFKRKPRIIELVPDPSPRAWARATATASHQSQVPAGELSDPMKLLSI